MLEGGAELWVASASALLMNPTDAMSSEGTACTEHSLQSSVPLPRPPGLGATAVSQPDFYPLGGGGGSTEAPRVCLIHTVLCNVTRKLVQFIFTFPVN